MPVHAEMAKFFSGRLLFVLDQKVSYFAGGLVEDGREEDGEGENGKG